MRYEMIINLWDKFPLLEHTTPPVKTLYFKGNKDILESKKFVGIVGPRKPTIYGVKAAQLFSKYLAQRGVCVVSGLALGVDAKAHFSALDAGGKTIGVTACDLDRIYPKTNHSLYKQMYKKGLILSEHRDDFPPTKWAFPMRNRIVAGICDAIIVVEAGLKSGALITANLGMELGVRVLSVPGSVFSMNSMGTNRFIEQGAEPLHSTDQLDFMLGIGKFEGYSEDSILLLETLRELKIATIMDLSNLTGVNLTMCMKVLQELIAEGVVGRMGRDKFALLP